MTHNAGFCTYDGVTLESSPAKWDLRALVDSRLNRRQQCALATKKTGKMKDRFGL